MNYDRIAIHRSFWREVEMAVSKLPDVSVHALAELAYGQHRYPLLCVEYPRRTADGDDRLPVLLSAGVHGDEPAGVHAALDFLRDVAPGFGQHYRFVVYPCVNPSGYEANTLETMSGTNLNRSFARNSDQIEVRAIEAWLRERGLRFRVIFDLHEAPPYYVGEGFVNSDNPTGTYLYETVTDMSPRIGHEMIAALPPDVEVCQWPSIYEDINDGGVVAYPQACRNWIYAEKTSLDAYLNGRFTHHSFTTETPTAWPFERRVQTHLTYLTTALRLIAAQDRELHSRTPELKQ